MEMSTTPTSFKQQEQTFVFLRKTINNNNKVQYYYEPLNYHFNVESNSLTNLIIHLCSFYFYLCKGNDTPTHTCHIDSLHANVYKNILVLKSYNHAYKSLIKQTRKFIVFLLCILFPLYLPMNYISNEYNLTFNLTNIQ